MDLLLGRINWNSTKDERVQGKGIQENNKFKSKVLDLKTNRIHNFNFDNKNFIYNGETKILCTIIGYISNLEEIKSKNSIDNKNDVEIIEKLYRLKGPKFISDLEGIFSIFIWDDNKQKGYIFQDEYGSSLPIYYAHTKEKFIFSTCLKEILKELPFKRELNYSVVLDILSNGHIRSKSTLIKGIDKLIHGQYIIIEGINSSIKIKSLNIKERKVKKEFAKKHLIDSIKSGIDSLSKNLCNKNLNCTLSGGFDSNLVLYFLTKLKQVRINAITIHGKNINETTQAKLFANQHDNVEHTDHLVKSNKLNYLPDMAWILEGFIFSHTIFLFYELAEQLEKKGKKSIFLGNCAECYMDKCKSSNMARLKYNLERELIYCYKVIFKKISLKGINKNRLSLLQKYLQNSLLKLLYFNDMFEQEKRTGIIFNAYGIQGLYPFLNKNTKIISQPLKKLNAGREFYKKEVKKVLGEKKSKHLSSSTEILDLEYLFKGKYDLVIKLLQSEFVRCVLNKKKIAKVMENPQSHFFIILQLFFLYLFNELFVSGKFDSKFNDVHLDMPLSDFFE